METANCANVTTVVSDYQIMSELNLLVILCVVLSVIATFTVTANILVVMGVIKSIRDDKTSRSINKITKLLMSSMGITDALFGAIVMPLSIAEVIDNGKWHLGHDLCTVHLAVNNTLSGISIYHICLMAMDKYLSICKPLKYRVLNTNRGYVIVGISWIFPAVFINIPLSMEFSKKGVEDMEHCYDYNHMCMTVASPHVLLGIFCFAFYLPLTLTHVLYVIVLHDIHRFNQRKNNSRTASNPKICSNNFSMKQFSKCSPNMKRAVKFPTTETIAHGGKRVNNSVKLQVPIGVKISGFGKKNLKAFRTIGSIVLCFNLCWFPTSICVIYFGYSRDGMPEWSVLLMNWFSYLNAAINPMLYCGNRSVRRSVKALLWRS